MDEARALYEWFLPLLRLDTVPKFVQLIKLVQAEIGQGNASVRPPRLELAGDELAQVTALIRERLACRPKLDAKTSLRLVARSRRASLDGEGTYARIYAVVRRDSARPASRRMARSRASPDFAGHARLVGYALSALPNGTSVPWHRVINAQGKLSLERVGSSSGTTQRIRLVREGIVVNAGGKVSLARFGWRVKNR